MSGKKDLLPSGRVPNVHSATRLRPISAAILVRVADRSTIGGPRSRGSVRGWIAWTASSRSRAESRAESRSLLDLCSPRVLESGGGHAPPGS
eukprot:15463415-Alexandrium_andersonii.AAC.1